MKAEYSVATIRELEELYSNQNIIRPRQIRQYDPGKELTFNITGVIPPEKGIITLRILHFVGGGFAGQVYKIKVLKIELPKENIPGLEEGQEYAMKILVPVSGFARWFRSTMYAAAYQGPFSLQVNPDAARAGALWQKFLRRGMELKTGENFSVVNILATFIDNNIGSCGEISEWVDGRMWRFESDDNLDARKRRNRNKNTSIQNSPEYHAKKKFMADLVDLMHEMGAPELARQYEWGTCKSQPNAMKHLYSDPDPLEGHVAVDFRAGLALLPFLPQSPGDFRLIIKGLLRGNLVQFDRGDLDKLKSFIDENRDSFSDLFPAFSELEKTDSLYRNSLPDITHHHFKLLYKKDLQSSIKKGSITGWNINQYIDVKTQNKLQKNKSLFFIYYTLGIIPLLGKFLRKIIGRTDIRQHYKNILTSPKYFLKASRARIAGNLIRWHRSGRVNSLKAMKLSINPFRFYAHLPLSFLPVGLHRFLSDKSFMRQTLHNIFIRPVRLYFKAEEREKWLRDMVSQGEKNGMLSSKEKKHILSQVKEPYIQKYLKSLAVHVCTVPVTQIVSLIVAIVYVKLHPEFSWQQATMYAGLILGLFQVTPISPGSLVRGLYVTFLVIRERNFKDYNIAFFMSFFKYIGYLAFPIQMAYRYPELARFMAGHWATGAVHIVPIFGERGALLEHGIFDLFYNFPLTIRRRMRLRKEKRAHLRPRVWHIPVYILIGTGLLSFIDLLYNHLHGHLPKFSEIWWIGIWVPFSISAAVSQSARGASLPKRIFYGSLSGTIIGLFYTVMNKAILPGLLSSNKSFLSFPSFVENIGISSLWIMFLFTLLAILGAFYIETKPLTENNPEL